MNDKEFAQKMPELFRKHRRHIIICDDKETILVTNAYFTREQLLNLALSIIKLEVDEDSTNGIKLLKKVFRDT